MKADGRSVATGLTLGKFAPLHRGHQLVIETALAEVENLIVLVYDCPETTRLSLEIRARWLRDLYPSVEVIEARGGPLEVGSDPVLTRAHDEYILRILEGRKVTHFYSSEFYGEHVSAALSAIDRRIDPARERVAVSGTAIRADAYRFRNFVCPRVYRDLVTNVVFLGAPSTGKTTLCEKLAAAYDTVWMPEYGREYWERHQVERRLPPAALVEIAEVHVQREEQRLLEANRYLFTDTNALTTLLFARYYHGSAAPHLETLANGAVDRYDITFLCDDDVPYDDTWDRSGEVNRSTMQRWTIEELERRAVEYTLLTGSLERRMFAVKEVLSARRKFP